MIFTQSSPFFGISEDAANYRLMDGIYSPGEAILNSNNPNEVDKTAFLLRY